MSFEYITHLIDEAQTLGTVGLVVFTGGEPFVLGEDLFAAVGYAARKGFLSRIVTNAFWATSLERACEVLSRLKGLGLTEINYSCDDFHQEFIPLERLRWANLAAIKTGIPALIASKGLKDSKITPQYLSEFFGVELAQFKPGQENPSNNVISYGITVPVGWESDKLSDHDLRWPEQVDCWKSPCSSVLESIVITPHGELAICCGIGSIGVPETIVGDTKEAPLLDLLIRANSDLMVNWLALEGPYGIMRFVQTRAPDVSFRERYVNTCHLCHDIFSRDEVRAVLNETALEKAPIVSLERAWLETHRDEVARRRVGKQNTQ